MRFSWTTVWLRLKVRLIVAGLVFGTGFYGGLVHAVLTRAYWPGVESLGGLIVFLGLGVLVGLWLPRFRRPGLSFPGREEREPHPVVLARVGLGILAGVLLVGVLVGSWLTNELALMAGRLPERFLLVPQSWRLLAFVLPAVAAVPVGILFGLILDLAFSLFVYLECPNHRESDSPDVQRTTGSLIGGILLALAVSWSLGHGLGETFSNRWRVLSLVPIICSLGVVLLSLVETSGEAAWLKHVRSRGNASAQPFPERAARTSLWGGLAFVLLGWFVVWNALHWSYAVSNWLGADRMTPGQSFALVTLAALTGTGGVRLGLRSALRKASRSQSAVDRRGLAVALQGVLLILTLVAANGVLKAEQILTLCPQVVLPLCLMLQSGLWGTALGLILPALAAGRPSRFDVWIELAGKLTTGAVLAGGLYVAWQGWGVGNLLAIALASLLMIAMGGVAIIYSETATGASQRAARTAWRVHLLYVLFLYVSLGLITTLVPHLKTSWLKPTSHGNILLTEGRAGVACLDGSSSQRLVWANRIGFPERVTPELRDECRTIVQTVLTWAASRAGTPVRALAFGLPFLSDGDLRGVPVAPLKQMDIDSALRTMELKFLELEGTARPAEVSDLNYGQRPYHVVIVMVPSPRPTDHCWPDLSFLTRRIYRLARRPEDVWFLCVSSERQSDVDRGLAAAVSEAAGICLDSRTLDSPTGYRWHVFGPAAVLPRLSLRGAAHTPSSKLDG